MVTIIGNPPGVTDERLELVARQFSNAAGRFRDGLPLQQYQEARAVSVGDGY